MNARSRSAPDGRLAFTLAAAPIRHFEWLLPEAVRGAAEGSIFEWRSETAAMDIGRRLARDGGAALVIDYGHGESAVGDTFQAVSRHTYADVLTAPGTVDLTAHVDFESLARAVEAMGAKSHGPISQALFLRQLGIESRAATLKANASRAEAAAVDAALERLAGLSRSGMGMLFKAMAFTQPALRARRRGSSRERGLPRRRFGLMDRAVLRRQISPGSRAFATPSSPAPAASPTASMRASTAASAPTMHPPRSLKTARAWRQRLALRRSD